MKKREFIALYTEIREAKLKEMYKGKPHGLSCLAMSLVGVADEAEKLWRKQRATLKAVPVADLRAQLGGAA